MNNSLITEKINDYCAWRLKLSQTISDYRNWLVKSQQSDSVRELRLFDIMQTIKYDQMLVGFISDNGRGKTELINALFFPEFNLRLLPSEGSRSCPSEILWNSNEEPVLKLLPIETKKSEDTISYLKTTPSIWESFQLNQHSAQEMQNTLTKLSEQKEVTQLEADELGLWDPADQSMLTDLKTNGHVKIPAWRHAVINMPHPLFKSGLVILDTPNVGKLGAEPEITLNTIPNAHAVVFISAVDTGITASEVRVWDQHIKNRSKNKLAVLNKIDLLWNGRKSNQDVTNDIEKHINVMSHHLHLAPNQVFPVSAIKALSARMENNSALFEQSKLKQLEAALGHQIVKAKQEILGESIASECNEMIKASRKTVQSRLLNLRQQIKELKALQGENIKDSKTILAKVVAERKRYEASIPTFNLANEKISSRGEKLLKYLSASYLDNSIAESRREIKKSWTTVSLNKGMRNMMKQATELANHVTSQSEKIKKLADDIYSAFQSRHGFESFEVPVLDISPFINEMQELERVTNDFCKNPINVMTEKHFLIRKFFLGLGAQKQMIFEETRQHCEDWLNNMSSTLKFQMANHKKTLDERTENLMEAKESAKSLDGQISIIENEYNVLSKESQALDAMLLNIVSAMQPALKAQKAAKSFAFNENQQMPELSF